MTLQLVKNSTLELRPSIFAHMKNTYDSQHEWDGNTNNKLHEIILYMWKSPQTHVEIAMTTWSLTTGTLVIIG